MKSSCISHPDREPLIMVRQWQLEVCEMNYCAAALLSFFEYWHNWKLDTLEKNNQLSKIAAKHGETLEDPTGLLQFHTEEQLEQGLLGLYKRKSIRTALQLLAEKQFISIHKNPNPRYKFDNTKFFLFHAEVINQWLKSRKPSEIGELLTSGKKDSSQGKNAGRSGNNAGTIPETTTKDYISEITDLKEFNDEENKGFSGENPTRASNSEILDFAKKEKSTSKQDNPNTNPLTTELDQNQSSGQNFDLVGEDVYSAPQKFYTEKINNRIWQFSVKTDRVQLPGGSKYKLARAVTNKAIQLWLADWINSEADEEVSLAVDDSGRVWMYDSRMGHWMDEENMHSIAKLISIAEYQECFDLETYNEKAMDLFEQIEQAINRLGQSVQKISVANIAEFLGLDLPEKDDDEDAA